FFFFQAEDGIRDRNVTGVQTCALPILLTVAADFCGVELIISISNFSTFSPSTTVNICAGPFFTSCDKPTGKGLTPKLANFSFFKIGRASCRERLYISESEIDVVQN